MKQCVECKSRRASYWGNNLCEECLRIYLARNLVKDIHNRALDLEELVQACLFYANPQHYGERAEYWTVINDGGKTARKALRME